MIDQHLDLKILLLINYQKIVRKWLDNMPKRDMIDSNEARAKFSRSIILKITANELTKNNKYHPFNVTKFATTAYIPYYITNTDRIEIKLP